MDNIAWIIRQRETDGPLIRSRFHARPPKIEEQKSEGEAKENVSSSMKSTPSQRVQDTLKGNPSWVKRLYLTKKLEEHRGCVNTIQWNAEGNMLVTGSDDCKLNVWSAGPRYKLLRSLYTGHSRNIFCAKFVPFTGDSRLVSCGMDGEIRCTELNSKEPNGFLIYSGHHMVLKISFLPNSNSVFLSTHQDATVRLFDLRMKDNSPENIIIDLRGEKGERIGVNSIAMCPLGSYKFVLGCADPFVRLYDIRAAKGKGSNFGRGRDDERYKCIERFCHRTALDNYSKDDCFYSISVTGVDYNAKGEIAATYSREDAAVFSVNPNHPSWTAPLSAADGVDPSCYGVQTGVIQTYSGHRNVRTFLKEIAFLGDDEYVTTGSDCGNAFIWEKKSGNLVQLLEADESVVNGVAPHPWLPYLATCGIDSDGKVWEPGEELTFDSRKAERLAKDNKENASHDEGEISMTALWNFLAMLRSRGAGNGNLSQFFGSDSSNEEDDSQDEEVAADMEVVELSNQTRDKGNNYFKEGDYDKAVEEYDAALEHLESITSEAEEVTVAKLKSSVLCLLNRAACNLKRGRCAQVVEDCSKVLEQRPDNVKALFRRAKALIQMKRYEAARSDVEKAKELEPDNEEIDRLAQQLEHELQLVPETQTAEKDDDKEKGKDKDEDSGDPSSSGKQMDVEN